MPARRRSPGVDPGFQTLAELEARAVARWSPALRGYVEGGAGEERTLSRNRTAFAEAVVYPRVLRGVASVDPRTTLLGRPVAVPFFVSPMAYHGAIHADGETAIAAAASEAGVLAAFGTLSTRSLEEIGRASGPGLRWFQLYHQADEAVERALLDRAAAAGFSAIAVTVDVPVLGVRDRQAQGGFAIDRSVPVGTARGVRPPARSPSDDHGVFRLPAEASATWEWLDRLRQLTRLPLVVKGILTPADARRCAEHGAQGIVVSNHGGRQLDGAPATLDVLPEIARAVGDRLEVYLDGGVRRGVDVLVALARGARAVGVGRPFLWALGVGGRSGVARYLTLLKLDLAAAMALTGCRTVAEITPDVSPLPR